VNISSNPDLTTAQLSDRTGLAVGTLRMWESRHGFPSPVKLPGRHHRFSEQDVDSVREVLCLREQGLSLTAAIARVRQADRRRPASIFAGLRRSRPDVAPVSATKGVLLDLTHAIEDEYCARAGSGLLIASFQRVRFYRHAQQRWRELARTAELAVVLADFKSLRQPAHAPAEVPVEREHPLAREWTLVINSPGAQACLAAWEQPSASGRPDEASRGFELLWSFEPQVVHAATEVAVELIGAFAPAVAQRFPAELPAPAAVSQADLSFASGLTHRVVAYLGARLDAERGAHGPRSGRAGGQSEDMQRTASAGAMRPNTRASVSSSAGSS
jgi:DICT domain-containing protein/predicted DNA-binding transcriptional regulator AlpA